ncbi:hypothetical protein ACTFIU_006302 [Dictyostelium citrinum]
MVYANNTVDPNAPFYVSECAELLSDKVGGVVLGCSDQWFAECVNLIKHSAPVWDADKYVDTGKWMDGWETKRHNPDHDWCILKLGIPGVIYGFEIDTAYFTGNYPPHASIEALCDDSDPKFDKLKESKDWQVILNKSDLGSSCKKYYECKSDKRFTHLKFRIYPDGGVARLRVYGKVIKDWTLVIPGELVDLAAIENGGLVTEVSDHFYGNKNNIIMPGRSVNMGDGWETKRRRGPGNDWLTVKLAKEGIVKRIEVDTNWFKGNFPTSCSIDALHSSCAPDETHLQEYEWTNILPNTPLCGHRRHFFQNELVNNDKPYTHIRLNIFPDGGVSRLRINCLLPDSNNSDNNNSSNSFKTSTREQ